MMALHMLGKDPDSPNNGSPTLYYDVQDDTYVVQGWKVTDPAVLAQLNIPYHETAIRLPRRMMQFFPEVSGGEVSGGGGISGA
jgi:hypothetical protein